FDGGQRFEGWYVAAASHDHVRFAPLVVRSPLPDAESFGTVLDGLIHGQPLRGRLLPRDHDVDVVAAAQAVVGHRQEGVGIRRQVDTDDIRLFFDDLGDEPRVLGAQTLWV